MAFVKIKDLETKSGKTKSVLASNFKVKLFDIENVELTKNLSSVFKADDDSNANRGYLAGYMSTFGNADQVGDVIRKGAFSKTLKERTPRVLWQHNAHEPIGVVKEVYEDEKGLFAVIQLNLDIQRGLETYNLYKSGAMDSFSIGVQLEKYNLIESAYGTAYDIQEVKLLEVSAVTFPANEQAVVMSVKEHYEETINKGTSEAIDAIDKADNIDDLIEVLKSIKTKEENELMDYFKGLKSNEEVLGDIFDELFFK